MRPTLARLTLASLTTAAALTVASCQQAPAKPAGAPAPEVRKGGLWSEPRFTRMLQAYRRQLPGKLRALRFEMTESSASLQVQDPAEPAKAVSYGYKGSELSGPSPVDLVGEQEDLDFDDDLFDWDQVAVERIPTLVQAALGRIKLAGARVVQVRVARKAPDPAERAQRMRARIETRTYALCRAMEQKLRRLDREAWDRNPQLCANFGGERRDGKDAQPTVLPPMAVEISLRLQVPWGFGWLTADAGGTITDSGVHITGPPPATDPSRGTPFWRHKSGLSL